MRQKRFTASIAYLGATKEVHSINSSPLQTVRLYLCIDATEEVHSINSSPLQTGRLYFGTP